MHRLTAAWKPFICMMLTALMLISPFTAFAEYDEKHPELLEEDDLVATSVILIERSTGEVIFEKNADARMYPASTTKIMTVLLGSVIGNPDDIVTIDYTASEEYVKSVLDPDSSVLELKAGEQIRLEDLLYGCILKSGNDAALAIAQYVSGDESGFVNVMNETANVLGLTGTHYVNAHGLHDEQHYTTARDLATLTRIALDDPLFEEIVGSTTHEVQKTDTTKAYTVNTGHRIMLSTYRGEANSYYYAPMTGVKSGTTDAAGSCYVGSAERDGVQLISVVLNSDRYDVWRDTKKLMEYGFSQYMSVTFQELYAMNPLKAYVIGYDKSDKALGELELSCSPVDPTKRVNITGTAQKIDLLASDLRDLVTVTYNRQMKAPVSAGEIIGTMTYTTDKGERVEYNLLATRSIMARQNPPLTLEQIVAHTESDPNWLPPLTLEILLILLSPLLILAAVILVLWLTFRHVRRRYSRLPKNRGYLK